jgi:hypothetical protein
MHTLSASEARAGLYRLIDQTAESHTPVIISGKRANAVLVSRGRLERHSGDALFIGYSRHARVYKGRYGRAFG